MDIAKHIVYPSPPAKGRDETIDLVSLGTQSVREWGMGKSESATYEVSSIDQAVKNILNESGDGFILFLLNDQSGPQQETLRQLIRNDISIDVWYDDAIAESLRWPAMLDFVSPVNYFNMKVSDTVSSISSISLRCLLVHKEILVNYGFLDERFCSVEGAVKEWVHRLIYRGILFQYARLLPVPKLHEASPIPIEDQYRFI